MIHNVVPNDYNPLIFLKKAWRLFYVLSFLVFLCLVSLCTETRDDNGQIQMPIFGLSYSKI